MVKVPKKDIFTYINHPEWDSVTKDLVEQLPFIGDMIESIKDTFREMQPFLHDIKQVWGEIGSDILSFLKECTPLMTAFLKYSIVKKGGENAKIINVPKDIDKTHPYKTREIVKKIFEKNSRYKRPKGLVARNGGLAAKK